MEMIKKRPRFLNQHRINVFNFLIALVALLVGIPAALNQLVQFEQNRSNSIKTVVSYYSPPDINTASATPGERCISSAVSQRQDAYRCFSRHLVLDPCFFVDKYQGMVNEYLYCSASWYPTSKDVALVVPETGMTFNWVTQNKIKQDGNNDAWLIVLEDGTECRLISGAVGIAYGDKGNIYACVGKKYSSVTTGKMQGAKYFYDCKLSSDTFFKSCFAKQIFL